MVPFCDHETLKSVKRLEIAKIMSLQEEEGEALLEKVLPCLALFKSCSEFCPEKEDNFAIFSVITEWKQRNEDLFLYSR